MQFLGVHLPSNAPFIVPIMRRLGIREKIDGLVPKQWDNGVSRGQAAEVLLGCILHSEGPLALFRVRDHVREVGWDAVLGLDAEQLHDDKLGEMLDALVPVDDEGRPQLGLVSQLEQRCAHEAIGWLGIRPQQVLFDFSRLELRGAYRDSDLARPGRGSGAHKQLQIGLNVLAGSGLPVLSRVHAGNANHTVNVPANLAELQGRLPGRKLTVTTDSAGLSYENIVAYNKAGMGFISPKQLTRAEEEQMRSYPNSALARLDYEPESKGRYWGVETTWQLQRKRHREPLEVRVLIVRSSGLQRQERKALLKALRRVDERLQTIRKYLNKNRYRKAAYAREQIERAVAAKEVASFVSYELHGEDGSLELAWTIDYAALQAYVRRLGRYVLFTNTAAEEYDPSALLRAYKSQHQVEANFRQLKSELRVAPVFLKKENRILAIAALYVVALMILVVLQCLARRAGLETPRHRKMTARELLRTFGSWPGLTVLVGDTRYIRPNPLTDRQRHYLHALGLPPPDDWLADPCRPPDHARIPGT